MVAIRQNNRSRKMQAKLMLSSRPASVRDSVELDKSLERYYKYIVKLARIQFPRSMVRPEEFDDEVDDLSQKALITFWQKIIDLQITYPKAYLTHVVRTRCIDMVRQRKNMATSPLLLDQDGELYQGNLLLIPGDGMRDPVVEFERKEMIAEVVDDVLKLPTIQRYAMICMLKDEVGDTFPLVEIFAKHGIDIETINWPEDPLELQKLKSSLSVARKKLRASKSKYGLV
jgi:DNA-directed RNA polymerase specialized sigma24 family protein